MRTLNVSGLLALLLALAGSWMTTGCGTARPARPTVTRDAYYHRMITSGHAAFERGDITRAADLYENAWIRARVMDRAEAIGTAAYNLAISQMILGDVDQAHKLLLEAEHEFRRAEDPGVDVRLAQVEVAFRRAQYAEAWALTEALLPDLSGRRLQDDRVQVHTVRALLAGQEDDWERMVEAVDAAESAVHRATSFLLRARLAEAQGRLALGQERWLDAATVFDREAVYYRNAGRFVDMAVALERAADAYVKADEVEMALERYFRLARHFLAAEGIAEGLRVMQHALSLMPAEGPVSDAERWTSLYEEIEDGVSGKRKTQRGLAATKEE